MVILVNTMNTSIICFFLKFAIRRTAKNIEITNFVNTYFAPDMSTNKVYMTLFFKISKKTNYRSRDIHIIHNQKHFQASTIDSQILADFLM